MKYGYQFLNDDSQSTAEMLQNTIPYKANTSVCMNEPAQCYHNSQCLFVSHFQLTAIKNWNTNTAMWKQLYSKNASQVGLQNTEFH